MFNKKSDNICILKNVYIFDLEEYYKKYYKNTVILFIKIIFNVLYIYLIFNQCTAMNPSYLN